MRKEAPFCPSARVGGISDVRNILLSSLVRCRRSRPKPEAHIDAATVAQLDGWLDGIFDAANLEDLIGPASG
jgi:hypothetical protein